MLGEGPLNLYHHCTVPMYRLFFGHMGEYLGNARLRSSTLPRVSTFSLWLMAIRSASWGLKTWNPTSNQTAFISGTHRINGFNYSPRVSDQTLSDVIWVVEPVDIHPWILGQEEAFDSFLVARESTRYFFRCVSWNTSGNVYENQDSGDFTLLDFWNNK